MSPPMDCAAQWLHVTDGPREWLIPATAISLLDGAPPKFALVAHAMGGFVAFEVMRRAPDRVAKLALISTLASESFYIDLCLTHLRL